MSVISSTRPSAPASSSPSKRSAAPGGGVLVGQRDPLDAEARGLLEQQVGARLRREAHDLELAAAPDHVESLRADGAGRADDDDAAHRPECMEAA